MTSQLELGRRFRALHDPDHGIFVIPNPWDGASARMLASLGFKALATSSSASAATLGYRDGCIGREEALAHVRLIAGATDLPVSADFENGFGDTPEDVADAIRAVAEAGAVGCSIEDSRRGHVGGLYDFDLAVRRIEAAAAAARTLPFPFTLTARTEEFLAGGTNLDETIRRLRAFEAAGADVLFAPGLRDLDTVLAVCAAVSKPVNYMIGIKGASFSLAQLREAGVRRVSLSTALFRSAMAGLHEAAREAAAGTFGFSERAMDSKVIAGMLRSEIQRERRREPD